MTYLEEKSCRRRRGSVDRHASWMVEMWYGDPPNGYPFCWRCRNDFVLFLSGGRDFAYHSDPTFSAIETTEEKEGAR